MRRQITNPNIVLNCNNEEKINFIEYLQLLNGRAVFGYRVALFYFNLLKQKAKPALEQGCQFNLSFCIVIRYHISASFHRKSQCDNFHCQFPSLRPMRQFSSPKSMRQFSSPESMRQFYRQNQCDSFIASVHRQFPSLGPMRQFPLTGSSRLYDNMTISQHKNDKLN